MGDHTKAAHAEAWRRLRREGRQLTPLRWCVAGLTVLVATTSTPAVGFSGRGLVLLIAGVVFVAEFLTWPFLRREGVAIARVPEFVLLGASAVAIAIVQPNGLSELPAGAALFIAGSGLPPVQALVLGGGVTAGVAAALSTTGKASATSIAPSVLLCAVLGITGSLLRRYRLNQERTEMLLAELMEARDDQARAAAAEERASIARELHDVLAHSLSGLSIQLEVVRKLAGADAPEDLRRAVERSSELAKQGLIEARDAVGVLRRDDQLSLDRLPDLVEHFRRDLELPVTYSTEGEQRAVRPEVGLALYRVAGEALTNAVRHAAGAATRVELAFELTSVRLQVIDDGGAPSDLTGEGSGWGLVGLRERVKLLGGELVAGPAGAGWSVVVRVPA